MRTLLFIRGEPGSGKITTARILERELGWPLVWFHDFDFLRSMLKSDADAIIGDAVYATLHGMMGRGHNIIYVRPSRTPETVDRVRKLAAYHNYRFLLVGLTASYAELCNRVESRERREYRIGDRNGLDEYLSRPECYEFEGQVAIDTTGISPMAVAERIKAIVAH